MMILQSKSHILARYNFAMHDAMALRLRRRLFKINYLSYLNKNRATIGCPKLGIYLLPTRFRDRFLRFGQLIVAHSYVTSYKSCTKLRDLYNPEVCATPSCTDHDGAVLTIICNFTHDLCWQVVTKRFEFVEVVRMAWAWADMHVIHHAHVS